MSEEMSLEKALQQNTAALVEHGKKMDALLAALKNGGNAHTSDGPTKADPAETAAAETKKGPGRPKKEEPAAPKVSFDEMKAGLLKVKDAKGKDAAQAVIKDVGGAEKMDKIPAEKFAAVLAACEAALAEPEAAPADDEL